MTRKETSERYNISDKILKDYETWDLDGQIEKVAGAWQYDDRDLERLSMIITLYGIGFDSGEVESYMRLMLRGEETHPQRIAMLTQKRSRTLDEIHSMERQISTMDYLRYEMQKGKQI